MKVSLHYNSVKDSRFRLVTVELEGVRSLTQAEAYGHGICGTVSIEEGEAVYLSGVYADDGSFAAIPAPDFWSNGVIVKR